MTGLQYYQAANDQQIGALGHADVNQVLNYSRASPASLLTISQVENSLESLPIVPSASMISLHFTNPATEVLPSSEKQIYDIATLDDEDLSYDLNLKVAQTTKVSISYDVLKVGDDEAAKYLSYLKLYLDDPDMMLL